MKIDKNYKAADIQNQLRSVYPLLTIHFYKKGHALHEGSQAKEKFDDESLLLDINPELKTGEITLTDFMTVSELESIFEEAYNLHVQIFRRSGDLWLQTSRTDHWTLKQQQERALQG